MPAAELAEPPPHRGRAGEAQLVDQAVLQGQLEPFERGLAVGLHQVQGVGRHPAVPEQLRQRPRRRAGLLGGLPDHGVAAQQGRHQVPRGHRHREVGGGDHGRHPERPAEGEELLVGHLAGHGLPVQAPALAEEEGAGVDDLLDLAERLPQRLADLAGHQFGQRLLVGLHQPADLLDHAAAQRRRQRRPGGLPVARGPAGPPEGGGVRQLQIRHDLAELGGIAGMQHPGLRRARQLPGDHRPETHRATTSWDDLRRWEAGLTRRRRADAAGSPR